MCWSFSSDWNGERLLILVNRNQSYSNNDTSDRAAVQCIRTDPAKDTQRSLGHLSIKSLRYKPIVAAITNLVPPSGKMSRNNGQKTFINSVFLPSLLCYYVIITTIKLVLWRCVILWRIHNTVIWLENVKIDKNCNLRGLVTAATEMLVCCSRPCITR